MRNQGSPEELEHRRFRAIRRLLAGYSTEEVAEFLDVDPRLVRRWFSCFRPSSDEGLRAGSVSGRLPKLSTTQEKIILRWLNDEPTVHGFDTALWTGRHLAHLIQREFGIRLNPRVPLCPPGRPGLALTGVRLGSPPHRSGFPCGVGPPLQTCRRHYPGGTTGSRRFAGGLPPHFPQ
jgi:transposase